MSTWVSTSLNIHHTRWLKMPHSFLCLPNILVRSSAQFQFTIVLKLVIESDYILYLHSAFLSSNVGSWEYKGTPPNNGAPLWFGGNHYCPIFNLPPIFNPKPPLESLERQLLLHNIRLNLAVAPCAFIRHITVSCVGMTLVVLTNGS